MNYNLAKSITIFINDLQHIQTLLNYMFMNIRFYNILLPAVLLFSGITYGQIKPIAYLPNAHSHNDYTRNNPFKQAYGLGFGSIEVDLFLKDGELYVAHDPHEITKDRTFTKLYLEPILEAYKHSEDGFLYPNQGQLQLLIDPKTEGAPILDHLTKLLKPHRELFDSKNNPKAVKLLISGNRPKAEDFPKYDDIFYFDGNLSENYSPAQLERIGLISVSFGSLSKWNGLGRLTDKDLKIIKTKVDSVHRLGKKIRFWASPDTKTTWYEWPKIGIDYINTDKPFELSEFLINYPKESYKEESVYTPYEIKTKFKTGLKPKNIILLISDGAGLSQLWAAAMANNGKLNVLNMPHTGYLKTQPTDNYHTDSAAGGSAIATGSKTKNRHIGVDSMGNKVTNIPDRLAELGMRSGIISNDEITGATPSAFYTHVSERDQSDSIANDLINSNLDLVIGGKNSAFEKDNKALVTSLENKGFKIETSLDELSKIPGKRALIFQEDQVDHKWNKLDQDQSKIKTSYRFIEHALNPAINFLQKDHSKGFFLMIEGAKIDGGGHSNSMGFTITEYLSFDRLVGQALEFAEKDQETLIIVTSDHETGGLVILDADQAIRTVLGDFATTDHTGIPVPLMAFGPGAENFQGFLDNTDIAKIIYRLKDIK